MVSDSLSYNDTIFIVSTPGLIFTKRLRIIISAWAPYHNRDHDFLKLAFVADTPAPRSNIFQKDFLNTTP